MSASLIAMNALLQRARGGLHKAEAVSALCAGSRKRFLSSSPPAAEPEMVSSSHMASEVNDRHRTFPALLPDNQPLLMGAGPSNPHPKSLAAMSTPMIGHMHKECFELMDEIQEGLRYAFQTDGKHVIGLSASGGAAMETAVANLLEPGEKALVSVAGIWGERFSEKCRRHGAEVEVINKCAGQSLSLDEIGAALDEHKPDLFFTTHGESSSGTRQKLEGVAELCAKYGTLLCVDTVCTLGGEPFFADKWGIDLVYTGAQKCLGCPPGLSPIYFSDRAIHKVQNRETPVNIFNFDILEVGKQWGLFGETRPYHHTPPVSLLFAMREALNEMGREGLPAMWERHQACHNLLWKGLRKLGLRPFVKNPEDRLSTVNCVALPDGVDANELIKHCMTKYNLEIQGGLGRTAGRIIRVGLMGYNCTHRNVNSVISSIETGLEEQGFL